jgi:homoserine dehydrogenase
MTDPLKVALLGCGVVGSQVVRLMREQANDLAARVGAPLELAAVAVRRPQRHAELLSDLVTTDAAALVARADIDLVVEVIGGIEPVRGLLLSALRNGKSVVSANKALLAEDGGTLHDAAAEAGVDLYYEAAVAGAIPLLRPLRESLAGDRITRVMGIFNGTTNFILSRMDATGASFDEALAEATALGYAEADPTADVDGFDAAAKAAILAGLAFHTRVTAGDVHREGIGAVTAADVASAKAMGCTIKLLAICERVTLEDPEGVSEGSSRPEQVSEGSSRPEQVSVRVYPAMIPRSHPLAGVGDAFNAVFVEAEAAGSLMFYGRGAGGAPTASAVLGDLVAVARNRVSRSRGTGQSAYADLPIQPMGDVRTRYHVALDVADQSGVLAKVATAFSDHRVSIQTVRQEGRGDAATLVIVTHTAPDAALSRTVDELTRLDLVRHVASVMRVEGMSSE